jgi:hypothetical protein
MPRTSRRAPKPEPFWRDLIERWKTSGQSIAAFCASHRVSQATFYSRRKRLTAHSRPTTARPSPTPKFAPVRVIPDPTVEVVFPSGLVVRVPIGADAAVVARLVAAPQGVPC